MIHLYVKVTQALIVVPHAAIALVEQIFVDGAFFENGNHVLDALRTHLGAFHQHLHSGSLVGREAEVGLDSALGNLL